MAPKSSPKLSLDGTRQTHKIQDLIPTSPDTRKHLSSAEQDIEPSKPDQKQRNYELEAVPGSGLRSREDTELRPFVQFFEQQFHKGKLLGSLVNLFHDTNYFRVPWPTKLCLASLLEMCQGRRARPRETTVLQMVGKVFEGNKACLTCQAGKGKKNHSEIVLLRRILEVVLAQTVSVGR